MKRSKYNFLNAFEHKVPQYSKHNMMFTTSKNSLLLSQKLSLGWGFVRKHVKQLGRVKALILLVLK